MAVRELLEPKLAEWGSRWPNATPPEMLAQLQVIGITLKQAQAQWAALKKARLQPADEEGTEYETPPRERYAALILEIIDFDELFFTATSQLAMGDLLATRPHVAGLLKLVSVDDGVCEVARELVRSWSTISADAWAVGGTGAPLQFAHARYQRALPEFLTKLTSALVVAVRQDAARHDLRLAAVAALVEAPGVIPAAIAAPQGSTRRGGSGVCGFIY